MPRKEAEDGGFSRRGRVDSGCSLKCESPNKKLKREDSAELMEFRNIAFQLEDSVNKRFIDFEDKVEELIKQYFNEIYARLINVFAKIEIDPKFGPSWSKLGTDFRFKSKDTDAFVQDKGLTSEDVEPPLKQVVVDIFYTSLSLELNARKRLERSFDVVSGRSIQLRKALN